MVYVVLMAKACKSLFLSFALSSKSRKIKNLKKAGEQKVWQTRLVKYPSDGRMPGLRSKSGS